MNTLVVNDTAAITAASMVSALGYDMANACAAARAGLSRPSQFDGFVVDTAAGDAAGEGVTAHCMTQLTDGFEGFARLLRITLEGLRQLPGQSQNIINSRTGLYVSLSGLEDEKSTKDATAVAQRLFATAAEELNWRELPQLRFVAASGHTGIGEACQAVLKDFAGNTIDNALVCAIDSMMQAQRLNALEQSGRLKTENSPAGLQPGEAGVFLMLDRNDAVAPASVLARINGIVTAIEPPADDPNSPSTGMGLAASLHAVEKRLGSSMSKAPWVISDQNGEIYRAYDWGAAMMRLADSKSAFVDANVWYPIMAFGDTGAASGAINIAVCLEAFRRKYAPSDTAIVQSAEGQSRSAIILTR